MTFLPYNIKPWLCFTEYRHIGAAVNKSLKSIVLYVSNISIIIIIYK